jgi:hypothetical protein
MAKESKWIKVRRLRSKAMSIRDNSVSASVFRLCRAVPAIWFVSLAQPYSELRKKFRDKNIPEDLLIDLIDKYNAFQADPDWHHLGGELFRYPRKRRETICAFAMSREDGQSDVIGNRKGCLAIF